MGEEKLMITNDFRIGRDVALSFEAFAEDDGGTWYLGYDHNGLYYYDNKNRNIQFIGLIPNEERYATRLYSSMVIVDDYLIMIPYAATEIAVYKKSSKSFMKIEIKSIGLFQYIGKNVDERAKFWSYALLREQLFMFPHNYTAIAILDLNSWKVEYSIDLFCELDKITDNGEAYVTDVTCEENMVYGSCGNASAFFSINLDTYRYTIKKVKTKVNGFNGILHRGNSIWLAPRIGRTIVRYDEDIGSISEYDDYPEGFMGDYIPFHKIYHTEYGLLLFANFANFFIMLNEENGEMKNVKFLSNIVSEKRNKGSYATDRTMAYSCDGIIVKFVSGRTNELCIANLYDENVRRTYFFSSGEYPSYQNIIRSIFYSEKLIVNEGERLELSDLITMINK